MPSGPIPCRLCGAPSLFRFVKMVLRTYQVGYFECTACGSLQTEKPYWLVRARDGRTHLDVGRAQRNLVMSVLCAHILGRVGIAPPEPCLDWAGGEGIFCRFMRDRGFNFFMYDKFAAPIFATLYALPDPAHVSPAAVTAFEFLEHMAEPSVELNALFALRPRVLLCSTETYERQDENWPYLAETTGHHLFFYSAQAMEWIAGTFGYRYLLLPPLHAFVARHVWQEPEFADVRQGWETLIASKDSLMSDAAMSLLDHLCGDAWRYVQADYLWALGDRSRT